MNVQILQQTAERAAIYGLLSAMWLEPPSADDLEEFGRVPDESPAWAALREASLGANTDDLAVQFTQLFVGPKNHLPPFQSVWLEQQLEGESAASTRRYGDVLGIEKASDHLGSQLEMMAIILSAETDDPATQSELAICFFRDHLSWPEILLDAVAQRGDAFYQSVSRLTGDFLESESVILTP